MKKILIALSIGVLLNAGTLYAQTQRVNRTNSRTHDRSDATRLSSDSGRQNTNTARPDRMNQENDVDRNNTNNNTNTSPNNGNKDKTTPTTSPNGTNTNGGTGNNGSNINTNNPR